MGAELHTKTLTEIKAGLEQGEFSSVELTQALLDRIGADRVFPTINAAVAWFRNSADG